MFVTYSLLISDVNLNFNNNGVFFELFDAKLLKWSPLTVNGEKIPPNVHGDEGGLTWDSKRKLIYINAAAAYSKGNGKIYQ